MNFHFIARQPIIDHAGDIFAYDLYFSIANDKLISLRASVSTLISTLLNTYERYYDHEIRVNDGTLFLKRVYVHKERFLYDSSIAQLDHGTL